MKPVVIYTTRFCPYCIAARRLLEQKNVTFTEIRVDGDTQQRRHMMQLSGHYTVPQIFIDEQPIGGYDELAALDRAGQLDTLLAAV